MAIVMLNNWKEGGIWVELLPCEGDNTKTVSCPISHRLRGGLVYKSKCWCVCLGGRFRIIAKS